MSESISYDQKYIQKYNVVLSEQANYVVDKHINCIKVATD